MLFSHHLILTIAEYISISSTKKKEASSESGLFLGYAEKDTTNTEGVVRAKNMFITDVNIGDTVGFRNNADYRVRLPEPHGEVFRMHIDDIYYVVE